MKKTAKAIFFLSHLSECNLHITGVLVYRLT